MLSKTIGSTMEASGSALAKITWEDPRTNKNREYVLMEGATATIGRSSTNDIHIPEQHVSRQHAVIAYRDGIFMLTDHGSANGTWVNAIKVEGDSYPLMVGDEIRLFAPILHFESADQEDLQEAERTGRLISVHTDVEKAALIVSNGLQEGQIIPLLLNEVQVGRATTNATWEIALQDLSVSRPHARMVKNASKWWVYDLGSSNGTTVNQLPVAEKGVALVDGDTIAFGGSLVLFRLGMDIEDESKATKRG